jgi:hypothetical protein
MKSTLLAALLAQRTACPGRADLHYLHRVEGRVFEFDTAEMRKELGDIPLSHPKVRPWLAEFIAEGERECGMRSGECGVRSIPSSTFYTPNSEGGNFHAQVENHRGFETHS